MDSVCASVRLAVPLPAGSWLRVTAQVPLVLAIDPTCRGNS